MGEEKKNTEPAVLPEQKTQDEIYEEALEKAKQKTAEREAREAKQRAYYTQLAGQIYDLDEKVVETLGSSLGRVFNHDRERCIANMVHAMEERPDEQQGAKHCFMRQAAVSTLLKKYSLPLKRE